MNVHLGEIDAVTFDFYNTLVRHRDGRGRGALLMEYLQGQGLASDPWEHQVLYDVFEPHGREYAPHLPAAQKERYFERLAERVFARLRVRAPDGAAAAHARNMWNLLGPASLGVFPEVAAVLRVLRSSGYRLAVISNWQCGLEHFCSDLGIREPFDHVIASAEIGVAKPSPEIFHEVCERLGVPVDRVLHVGDGVDDDMEGARGAGLHAALVQRDPAAPAAWTPKVSSLEGVPELLGLRPWRTST